ncbi:lipid II:glycine glycyltransferase FemX [Patescibacteria group bacterium]
MKTAVTIQNLSDKSQTDWNNIQNHPLGSWQWGDFRRKTGVKVIRLGVYDHKKLTNGWTITFHKIPHTFYTIGYFPKGPVINKFMISKLIKLAKSQNAIYIQIEPNVLTGGQWPVANSKKWKADHYNLIKSHRPLFTKYNYILDLTKSEDELLKSMHSKTRYNTRLAEKKGVFVKEDNSPQAFRKYLELVKTTTSRQKFYAHNLEYHRIMWSSLYPSGLARLWIAEFEGKILAAWIIFVFKDTIYYPYGSSSRTQRKVMAPNLLLWKIATHYKKIGYKKFDLWGALGPNPKPNDPWYGFNKFKFGYNPKLVEYIGSYDLVTNKSIYKIFCIVNNVRWKILKTVHK